MARRPPPVTRRSPPLPVTVDRGGRRGRPAAKSVIGVVALAALIGGGSALWQWLAPRLDDARNLVTTLLVEAGLAEHRPDRHQRRSPGTATPLQRLHDALGRGDARTALPLVPQVSPRDHNRPLGGMTTLMLAAAMGNPQVVDHVLRSGGNPNTRGAQQRTALQYATASNRLEAARLLLDAGADIDGVDNGGLSPLVMAADRNYTALALMLIERGANVNLQTLDGWTALMDAAEAGNVQVVQALLSAGARTGARHRDGRTALDFARQHGHAEVIQLLAGGAPASPGGPPEPGKKGRRH